MTNFSARGGLVALVGFLICAPAIGQKPPASTASTPDPNEIVCEKQQVIGSRLQNKRVCMTRSEWTYRRSEDRQDLERRQQRGYKAE